jgi:putative photosynthetic complex assembly protein 2
MSLHTQGLPILFTLFLWWFSTGAILYLDGLPQRTFRWSLMGASVVLTIALYAMRVTSNDTSATGAYGAFTCALLVWGWLEMSFLMGFIIGPRTTACPPGAVGWQRATYAFEAILYHELALLVGAGLIAVLTWNSPNQLALWTFVVLWVARLSTKLNLFLGVRNLSEEFLPDHLRYLRSYFTRRSMNLLFPLSVSVGTIAAMMLWQASLASSTAPSAATGLSFLATLATLAMLEHWFLILPVNFAALWDWALGSRRTPTSPTVQDQHPDQVAEARASYRASAADVPTPASELTVEVPDHLAACRR